MTNKLDKIFIQKFGAKPDAYFWSPGRVNIIGEHTDYHEGFVMPAAINLGITWLVKKNDLDTIRVYANKFDETGHFKINDTKRTKIEWLQYFQGVAIVLTKMGHKFEGVDIAISSDIPIGSGLSSSSSLVTGFTYILNSFYELGLNGTKISQVACEAEWWYGTNGGIMDQFCIANAEKDHVLLLDTRTLNFELIKIPETIEIVVFETTVRHKQKDSPFDLRRSQARKVIDLAQEKLRSKKIKSLRDISISELNELRPTLIKKYGATEGDIFYRRAYHPISENIRVIKMKEALAKDDLSLIGKLLFESHESLRNNYEVSCQELDIAVQIAQTHKELIGARMVGGGFGGCTINLVNRGHGRHFAGHLEQEFRKTTGIKGNSYICSTSSGVRKI